MQKTTTKTGKCHSRSRLAGGNPDALSYYIATNYEDWIPACYDKSQVKRTVKKNYLSKIKIYFKEQNKLINLLSVFYYNLLSENLTGINTLRGVFYTGANTSYTFFSNLFLITYSRIPFIYR